MSAEKKTKMSKMVGRRVREIRNQYGLTQDNLSMVARERFGLSWTRPTIAAMETGKRQLSVEEFLLIPLILNLALWEKRANAKTVQLIDVMPHPEAWIYISPQCAARPAALRDIIAGKAEDAWGSPWDNVGDTPNWITPQGGKSWEKEPVVIKNLVKKIEEFEAVKNKLWPETKLSWMDLEEVSTEPAQKMAHILGVSPFAIALAARKLWGHSLTEERDNRIAQENPKPRSLQAIRGHITRKLFAEIMPIIKPSRKVRGAKVKSSVHILVPRLGDNRKIPTKKVRMLEDRDGPKGKLTSGRVYELPTRLADEFLKGKFAEPVKK